MTSEELFEVNARTIAYDYSGDNIPLAEKYFRFLSNSKDDDERNIKERCLSLRRGRPIEDIEALFSYLVNGPLND